MRPIGLAALVLWVVAPGVIPGEAGRVVAPSAFSALSAQAQDQPRFRAATTLVEVDAIVRYRNGQFVADLTPDDFEVLEDGAPQKVESFYVVAGPQAAPRGAPVAPAQAAAAPAPPVPPAQQVQRVYVLFFDQEHMAPGSFDRARSAADEFLAKDFQPGDIGGIGGGGTLVNNRLTSDRKELRAAVRSLKPAGDTRSRLIEMRDWPRFVSDYEVWRVDYGDPEVLKQVVARAAADDPEACSHNVPCDQIVLEKARRVVTELRAAGMRTIQTVGGLANGLAKLPGRKTIVFLSDGFFAEDSWGNLRQLIGLSARASVRVYAIDTRGLNRGSASSDMIDTPPHAWVEPGGTLPTFDIGADAPNSLAIDTGGLMIRNENDFAKAFHEIADDTSSYYILGYRPTNTNFDGKFRQIAVHVKRAGVTVRARKGYMATTTPTPVTTPEPVSPAPPAAAPRPGATTETSKTEAPPVEGATTPPSPERPRTVPDGTTHGAAAGAVRLRPHIGDEVPQLQGSAPGSGAARGPAGASLSDALIRQARAGWDAYQRGDVKTAKAALSEPAANAAAPAWVHYVFGWAEFALSEYATAASAWERVHQAAPEFRPVYFDLADSYLQQREFGKAIGVLRDAERRWPDDVEVLNALGVVQTARGATNDAIDTFEKAVSLKPDDATSSFNLAKTYEMRYAQMQAFRRMQSSNPYLQDRDRAIEYYRKTILLGGPLVDSAKAGLKRLGGQE
jgi:VWFA-related protein